MTKSSHCSAEPSHYDEGAESYDLLNEENSRLINQVLNEILQRHKVKTVLDLTCGTGSQVFWLTKHGYKVTGSDINANMLKIAKEKAKKNQLDIQLFKGDMRTLKAGKFDAVITIFNAVGHLTKYDFEDAIQNIYENLNDNGLYIFDIFNLTYLQHADNITKLTIDWQKEESNKRVREIQYSTIDKNGILASYTTSHVQIDNGFEGPREQSSLTDREDILVFRTEEIGSNFVIAGSVQAIIYVSSTAVDTDFVVRLSDLHPDGKAYALQSEIARMRYRNGVENPELLEPGKVYKMEISLPSTCHSFQKGHRLQIQITSSDFPNHSINPNISELPEVAVYPTTAIQTIYSNEKNSSYLRLPILKT